MSKADFIRQSYASQGYQVGNVFNQLSPTTTNLTLPIASGNTTPTSQYHRPKIKTTSSPSKTDEASRNNRMNKRDQSRPKSAHEEVVIYGQQQPAVMSHMRSLHHHVAVGGGNSNSAFGRYLISLSGTINYGLKITD